MEIHKLKEELQSFFTDGLAIVVGSGLSAAEGIRGMRHLATYLCDEMPQLISPEQMSNWEKIDGALETGTDLGHTLCSNLSRSNLSSLHSSGRPNEHNFEHMPSFADQMWFFKYLK